MIDPTKPDSASRKMFAKMHEDAALVGPEPKEVNTSRPTSALESRDEILASSMECLHSIEQPYLTEIAARFRQLLEVVRELASGGSEAEEGNGVRLGGIDDPPKAAPRPTEGREWYVEKKPGMKHGSALVWDAAYGEKFLAANETGCERVLMREVLARPQQGSPRFDWLCEKCGSRFADPDRLGDPGKCPECQEILIQSVARPDTVNGVSEEAMRWLLNCASNEPMQWEPDYAREIAEALSALPVVGGQAKTEAERMVIETALEWDYAAKENMGQFEAAENCLMQAIDRLIEVRAAERAPHASQPDSD